MKSSANIPFRLSLVLLAFILLPAFCTDAAEGIFVPQWAYLRVRASDRQARTTVIDVARQMIEEHGWTHKGEKGSEIVPDLARVSITFEAAERAPVEIEFLSDDQEMVRIRVFAEPKLAQLVTAQLGARLKLKPAEAK